MQFSAVISLLLKCLCLILGRVRPGGLGKHKQKGKGGSSEFTFELVLRPRRLGFVTLLKQRLGFKLDHGCVLRYRAGVNRIIFSAGWVLAILERNS